MEIVDGRQLARSACRAWKVEGSKWSSVWEGVRGRCLMWRHHEGLAVYDSPIGIEAGHLGVEMCVGCIWVVVLRFNGYKKDWKKQQVKGLERLMRRLFGGIDGANIFLVSSCWKLALLVRKRDVYEASEWIGWYKRRN